MCGQKGSTGKNPAASADDPPGEVMDARKCNEHTGHSGLTEKLWLNKTKQNN